MPLFSARRRFELVAASAVRIDRASTNTASDATETALVTIPLPAIGPNGLYRVDATFSGNNNASTKNYRIRLGGLGGTQYFGTSPTTSGASARTNFIIAARGATNSQVGQAVSTLFGQTNASVVTTTVDLSASADLVFSCSWGAAVAAETISLERYVIEVMV